jgi:chromosome segregation protein
LYLSKLEIFGFKSFAQKTVVTFNEGVTSIVGPNGCGKTNIVDAIRWCLGEQRSSALRSDKMENVIFNGTSGRKPMGMAEVSLTIQNSKGILPTEYTEVVITRRIFRSGESEYLLNKNICRLKDITNLFMDTGIGANAYSVIELKMVETILSNKAEERRTMFEEAAGVNKYKLRRRLALRKLDEVKADLTRVNDIVTEVEKKVNSLERQAKRADKYNKLTSSLRELELDLSERELCYFNNEKENTRQLKEEFFNKKIVLDSDIARTEDEIASIKKTLNEIEQQLKVKQGDVNSVTEKVYNIQKNISVSEEREKSITSNIERFRSEINELKEQLSENEEVITANNDLILVTKVKIDKNTADKAELERRAEELKALLEEKRAKLKEHSNDMLEQFKDINTGENELSNIEKALGDKNKTIARFNERIQQLTGNIAKTVGFIEELNQEKNETELKLAESERVYTQKQTEKTELEKKLNNLKEKEIEDKGVLNGIRDKINFIQSLIDNLEGISKGAKFLLENEGWNTGDKILLAHIGNSDEKYRFAIEASLKNNLNNILIETIDDLKNGIEYLNSSNAGKASFYIAQFRKLKKNTILGRLNSYSFKKNVLKICKEKAFLGWAKDYILTDEKWKVFFNKILNNTAVVHTLDDAITLSDKYSGFNFVTLNGDYVDSSGIIEAGSAPGLDDTLFGRKRLLENLKEDYPRHEAELLKLRKQIEKTDEILAGIDLKVLSDKGRLYINDLANVEKQISQFEFEKKKAVDEIEKARLEIQELASESNRLDNEKIRISEYLNSRRLEKEKTDREHASLEEDFRNAEKDYTSIVNSFNNINLELERFLGEVKNLDNSTGRAEDSILTIKKTIERRESDITAAAEELTLIGEIIGEKKEELEELEFRRIVLKKEEEEIEKNFKEIKGDISQRESSLSRLHKDKDSVTDEIHAKDIKLNELIMKMSNLIEHIKETYSLTLEMKAFEDNDTFDFKSRTEEVHALKQQVKNLGPINLLAYSEFEEERERFEFLSKQRDDLIASEKDIAKTIDEINTTAQQLFMDTFEKIRENFTKIFRNLFNPGDEADLRIEENADPLEAKIEIIAKPKGKRPTSIELLSGGEKTLTAIALLFAIYLVKPSPFCILDEIDAPLDDANIDRFTKIIKDFSADTQFIVVTHNKRTMEAADTLYGVTMQEEGISKLVSVRFNEDLNIAS